MKKLLMISLTVIFSLLATNSYAYNIYELIGKTIDGCKIVDVIQTSSLGDYSVVCIKKNKQNEYILYYNRIISKHADKNVNMTIKDIYETLEKDDIQY